MASRRKIPSPKDPDVLVDLAFPPLARTPRSQANHQHPAQPPSPHPRSCAAHLRQDALSRQRLGEGGLSHPYPHHPSTPRRCECEGSSNPPCWLGLAGLKPVTGRRGTVGFIPLFVLGVQCSHAVQSCRRSWHIAERFSAPAGLKVAAARVWV